MQGKGTNNLYRLSEQLPALPATRKKIHTAVKIWQCTNVDWNAAYCHPDLLPIPVWNRRICLHHSSSLAVEGGFELAGTDNQVDVLPDIREATI